MNKHHLKGIVRCIEIKENELNNELIISYKFN